MSGAKWMEWCTFQNTNSCRGGGEYGRDWRDAGSKGNKQNVFDDFQAAAEHLHAQGYSSPATTTIQVSTSFTTAHSA